MLRVALQGTARREGTSCAHPDSRKLGMLAEDPGEFFRGGTMAGQLSPHLMADTDEFGRPLASDLDHWWERLGDRAVHAIEALEPQPFLELAMMVEVLRVGGEELLTRDGEVRTWGQHLTPGAGGGVGRKESPVADCDGRR